MALMHVVMCNMEEEEEEEWLILKKRVCSFWQIPHFLLESNKIMSNLIDSTELLSGYSNLCTIIYLYSEYFPLNMHKLQFKKHFISIIQNKIIIFYSN